MGWSGSETSETETDMESALESLSLEEMKELLLEERQLHKIVLYASEVSSKLDQLEYADGSQRSQSCSSSHSSTIEMGSSGRKSPTSTRDEAILETVDLSTQLHWTHPERKSVCDCVEALFTDRTFTNLRTALKSSEDEEQKEKALCHPVTFTIIEHMMKADLVPQGLHWFAETLTERARICVELASFPDSTWSESIRSSTLCSQWTNEPDLSDRANLILSVVRRKKASRDTKSKSQSSASATLSDPKSQETSSACTTPRVGRQANGLFSLKDEHHSHLCRQRHGRLAVELMKNCTNSSLHDATRKAQRDFASTYPRGCCPLLLCGDGFKFGFLHIHPLTNSIEFHTTRSQIFDTTTEQGMRDFIETFYGALTYARGFCMDGSSPPLPGPVLKYRSFTFERTLAVNKNSIVILLLDEIQQERLVVKADRIGGRSSITDEKKIFRTLSNMKLLEGLTPMVPTKTSYLLMQHGGTALPHLCLCIKEQNDRVRNLVEQQLNQVLGRLHLHKLMFVDVHPGNILLHNDTVVFTDVESVRPFDRSNDRSTWRGKMPATCLATVKRKPSEWPSQTTDEESLTHVLQWIETQMVP